MRKGATEGNKQAWLYVTPWNLGQFSNWNGRVGNGEGKAWKKLKQRKNLEEAEKGSRGKAWKKPKEKHEEVKPGRS
jgi:hypothetical protein